MALPGRPTPQRPHEGRPRFRDRSHELPHQEVNPYLVEHRELGPIAIPADEGWAYRGRWEDSFGRPAPLHVEIGSGNGFFLTELAQRHPDWNLLGVEIRYKRIVLCARKIKKAGLTNARILRYHAAFLDDILTPGSISGLYVNHPDPWPKGRHEGNRLISAWFLKDVATYLVEGGHFRLKSDHLPNIERVQTLLDGPCAHLPLKVWGTSPDVNTQPAPWPDDIETKYQRKFKELGKPVFAVEVRRVPGSWPTP
jgi:tRNA (guanine-N7-)-methyltransferase